MAGPGGGEIFANLYTWGSLFNINFINKKYINFIIKKFINQIIKNILLNLIIY